MSIDLWTSLILLVPVVATGGVLEGQGRGGATVTYLDFCLSVRKVNFNLHLFCMSKVENLFICLKTIQISSKNFLMLSLVHFFLSVGLFLLGALFILAVLGFCVYYVVKLLL